MKKTLIIVLIAFVIIVGGIEIVVTLQKSGNSIQNQEIANEAFTFKDGDKQIILGDEFSKESIGLGEEKSYSEIESCAFKGLDKTYTYENYEITTFPDGDKDRVYTIYFLNEQISTTEGVKISDTKEKMINIYGQEYEIQGDQYTYKKGQTNLEFIVQNDIITSIQYSYITE